MLKFLLLATSVLALVVNARISYGTCRDIKAKIYTDSDCRTEDVDSSNTMTGNVAFDNNCNTV